MNLEDGWKEKLPSCESCGWCPAYYEIADLLELEPDRCTEGQDVYWAPCVSKDDEDSGSHRGHFLYIKKPLEHI